MLYCFVEANLISKCFTWQICKQRIITFGMYSLRSKLPWCSNSGDEQRAQFSREARPLKRGAVSERGQAAHMLEARERRQAHRLHSDPLAKSHHSSLTCAFVSQVYPSFNPPPTICAFCHVSVVQMGSFYAHSLFGVFKYAAWRIPFWLLFHESQNWVER